jgi:hypothetical protein
VFSRVYRGKNHTFAPHLSRLVISLHPSHALKKQTASLSLFVNPGSPG